MTMSRDDASVIVYEDDSPLAPPSPKAGGRASSMDDKDITASLEMEGSL